MKFRSVIAVALVAIPFCNAKQESVFDSVQEIMRSGNWAEYLESAGQNMPNLQPMLKMAKGMMHQPEFAGKMESVIEKMKRASAMDDEETDEVILNFDHLDDNIKDKAAPVLDKISCEFTCPKQNLAILKENWKPRSNGCGIEGFMVNDSLDQSIDFTSCCNQHDYCYDTCGNKKIDCDKSFLRCMKNQCRSIEVHEEETIIIDLSNDNNDEETERAQSLRISNLKRQEINPDQSLCLEHAQVYYQATVSFGCSPFMKCQTEACDCSQAQNVHHQSNQEL